MTCEQSLPATRGERIVKYVLIGLVAMVMAVNVACGEADERRDDKVVADGDANSGQDPSSDPDAPACETRADCLAAQECVEDRCVDHLECNIRQPLSDWSSFLRDAHCAAEWKECDDQKTYRLECSGDTRDDYIPCRCIVNDVDVSEFSMLNEGPCADDQLHRIANEGCAWVVPETHLR